MIKKLILTSRPLFWLTHFAAFLIGINSLSRNTLSLEIVLLSLFLLSLPLSIFIYGINDITDYESDLINDRKGGIFGLKHDNKDLRIILITSLLGGLLFATISLFLGLIPFLLSLLSLFILGFYSLKPIRFKNIPIIDSVMGGGMYSLLIALWSYSVFNQEINFSKISLNPFLFLFSVGFTIQALGTILDHDTETKLGIRTSSTFLGKKTVALITALVNLSFFFSIEDNWFVKIFLILFSLFSLSFVFEKINNNNFVKKYSPITGIIFSFIITLIIFIFFPELIY
jgi:lycopene elongase/hydratase (dihydrobisanhydrobacterioruberin-forming)